MSAEMVKQGVRTHAIWCRQRESGIDWTIFLLGGGIGKAGVQEGVRVLLLAGKESRSRPVSWCLASNPG